jgi:hypothetical protein
VCLSYEKKKKKSEGCGSAKLDTLLDVGRYAKNLMQQLCDDDDPYWSPFSVPADAEGLAVAGLNIKQIYLLRKLKRMRQVLRHHNLDIQDRLEGEVIEESGRLLFARYLYTQGIITDDM